MTMRNDDDMGHAMNDDLERIILGGDPGPSGGALTVVTMREMIRDLSLQSHGIITEFRCNDDMYGLIRYKVIPILEEVTDPLAAQNTPSMRPPIPTVPVIVDPTVLPGCVELRRHKAESILIKVVEGNSYADAD